MQPPILISDYRLKDGVIGGSEHVNETVIEALGCDFLYTRDIRELDPSRCYIIANLSTARSPQVIDQITRCRYVILEHDCKFLASRHPWRHPNSVAPKELIVNRSLYKNAIATFVQTDYHLDVFRRNGIAGRFYNMECGIWSANELDQLDYVRTHSRVGNRNFAVIESKNWIKNTAGAVKFCQDNGLKFSLISNPDWQQFINSLALHAGLVFFPLAGETLCRLVVEANCIGINVITSKNYGATLSTWYDLREEELTNFLRFKSIQTLNRIKSVLY
jgi:hypothetical protein